MKLYDRDFVAWVDEQALLLKQEQWDELDLVNLVEEVKDMGKSQRQALTSNLRVLLQHLLKYKYQAEKRSGSWRATIREHRKRVNRILKDSPSLKPYLAEVFDETYQDARELAADETELERSRFPDESPFTIDETLLEEFLPSDETGERTPAGGSTP